MWAFIIALSLWITAFAAGIAQAQLADPRVTQDNLNDTICRPGGGYTKTVRPPAWVTGQIKREMMAANGDHRSVRCCELDHIIALEDGGAPNDPRNFQIQSWAGPCNAHMKDDAENAIHGKICRGELTLAEGQALFTPVERWKQTYRDYVNNNGCESILGR